ncbi:MAG: hypothetical protein LBN07_00300 [Christensenellaceae bacterium]|jgi:hypothetical protein|nr:hypothetical protein [Christensenellaceae bacterium]
MKKYSDYLDFVENSFNECFRLKGYVKEQPFRITSRVDPTVDFIGSKISPLKRFVLDDNISNNGHSLIQDCLRTQRIKKITTMDFDKFGSCFRMMGTLTKPNIEKVVGDTFEYLMDKEYLGISPDDLRIRICSQDKDLIEATKNVDNNVVMEFDTDKAHYKHKYGLDAYGIFGRDFNIAMRKQGTNEFINTAAIVLMENEHNKLAVDMGIGGLTLSMCKFGNDSAIASSRMADVFDMQSIEEIKFADSMIAVATLQNENVHKLSRHESNHAHNIRAKFKKYNDAVSFWQDRLDIDDNQTLDYMNKYVELQFKENNFESENTWTK